MEGSYKIVTTEKVLQTGTVECLFVLEIYILKCCTTAETAVIHFLHILDPHQDHQLPVDI